MSTIKTIINLLIIVSVLSLVGCAGRSNTAGKEESKSQLELKGVIKNYEADKIVMSYVGETGNFTNDTLPIKDGKFIFSNTFEYPEMVSLHSEDRSVSLEFYVENGEMTLEYDVTDPETLQLNGSKFNKGFNHYHRASKAYKKEDDFESKYYDIAIDQSLSQKERDAAISELNKGKMRERMWLKSYIKENPTSLYCAAVLYSKLTSKSDEYSAKELKELIELIDESVHSHPVVKRLLTAFDNKMEAEISVNKFITKAPDLSYSVDESYLGSKVKNVLYLSIFKNDDLCVLEGNESEEKAKFSIQRISGKGLVKAEFKIETHDTPTVVTVDCNNRIYAMIVKYEEKTKKVRGKSVVYKEAVGSYVIKYNEKGEKIGQFNLEGTSIPTGAKTYKDNLIVSDCRTSSVRTYNKNNGKLVNTMVGMRPCCGILDVDVDGEGNILVANLGAFRVTGFNEQGEKILSFGRRGKDIDSFAGCCNPVSVRKLNNQCLVTVEKDPSRIKVYGKNGAKVVQGVKELVKGCDYIPVISDSKSNIYLASPEKGIVKCVLRIEE